MRDTIQQTFQLVGWGISAEGLLIGIAYSTYHKRFHSIEELSIARLIDFLTLIFISGCYHHKL